MTNPVQNGTNRSLQTGLTTLKWSASAYLLTLGIDKLVDLFPDRAVQVAQAIQTASTQAGPLIAPLREGLLTGGAQVINAIASGSGLLPAGVVVVGLATAGYLHRRRQPYHPSIHSQQEKLQESLNLQKSPQDKPMAMQSPKPQPLDLEPNPNQDSQKNTIENSSSSKKEGPKYTLRPQKTVNYSDFKTKNRTNPKVKKKPKQNKQRTPHEPQTRK